MSHLLSGLKLSFVLPVSKTTYVRWKTLCFFYLMPTLCWDPLHETTFFEPTSKATSCTLTKLSHENVWFGSSVFTFHPVSGDLVASRCLFAVWRLGTWNQLVQVDYRPHPPPWLLEASRGFPEYPFRLSVELSRRRFLGTVVVTVLERDEARVSERVATASCAHTPQH